MDVDDILDLLAMILILGFVLSVSFALTLPQMDNAKAVITLEDKTAPKKVGNDIIANEKEYMTDLDVILLTQVQDFGLPKPKSFKVGSFKADISELYAESENLASIASLTNKALQSNGSSALYDIVYNWNSTGGISDDSYEIVRVR